MNLTDFQAIPEIYIYLTDFQAIPVINIGTSQNFCNCLECFKSDSRRQTSIADEAWADSGYDITVVVSGSPCF